MGVLYALVAGFPAQDESEQDTRWSLDCQLILPSIEEFWIIKVLQVTQHLPCAFLESAPYEPPVEALVHGSSLVHAPDCSKPPEDMLQDHVL